MGNIPLAWRRIYKPCKICLSFNERALLRKIVCTNVINDIEFLYFKLWSLGYHQSRMTYSSQEEVKDVVAKMVSNNFPMDSIWLDGGYTDSFKWYRWHPTAFSDPVEMQHNISAHNKTCVLMGDPLVKIDNNYTIYSGAKGEYFVLTSNKSDYKGIY